MDEKFPVPFGGIEWTMDLSAIDMHDILNHFNKCCNNYHRHNIAIQWDIEGDNSKWGRIFVSDLGKECIFNFFKDREVKDGSPSESSEDDPTPVEGASGPAPQGR